MTDIASMEALLVRVESATGPDREIDAALAVTVGWAKTPLDWTDTLGRPRNAPPAYTASLDAIVALIEQELPGAYWTIERLADDYSVASVGGGDVGEFRSPDKFLSPPIALTAAFLRARIAMERKE